MTRSSGQGPQPSREEQGLLRRIGLLQATALNTSNVVGIGPFITIPLLMSAMGGPQAMIGWLLGATLALMDGLVWSELSARWPGSGGTYHYFRQAFAHSRLGRLMPFLFIWQFLLSGPMEIASGLIGFSQYASYIWPDITGVWRYVLSAAVGLFVVVLCYRRISALGAIAVTLWVGTVLTIVGVIALGIPQFEAARAFAFPDDAFRFSLGFAMGLGSATLVAMYDYLGYYNVCYLGDEVRDPARVIPRSILYTVLTCFIAYLGINLVLIGSMPMEEVLSSEYVVSSFVERYYGRELAMLFSLMILWAAFGSVFALTLAYSRVPFAAARSGDFFAPFARLHPEKRFPHVSLIVIGTGAVAASLLTLEEVVKMLLTTRIIVQFIGQIFALACARRQHGMEGLPFKMWLYPLPALLALLGWSFVFLTSGWRYIALSAVFVLAGALVFMLRFDGRRAAAQLRP